MNPRCIKCNGQPATRNFAIKEKIEEPTCINCGEKGHLAAWKRCKAHQIIQKTSTRKTGKSYAQAEANKNRNEEKPELKNAKKTPDMIPEVSELKDSLDPLKELQTFVKEFTILLEAASQCRSAKSRQEKVLIVLNALVGV
ncbi:hypothetical protein AVEN_90349-1 [Araneus ventricosus]|uniref:Uncharacterized protein n=1 Tax=Araneus ventricosus TaxID=182803 RepID=A0A4Y2R4E1_ARAVE|nr:hypothetical protein AVEN_90349-1 [Araneus ventricosus]